MTDDFKAQFRTGYGRYGSQKPPDYTRCAGSVHERGRGVGSHQCARNNGFGPHGAWCKQHDPDAVAERRKAQAEKYAAEGRKWRFNLDCQDAIRQIAAGHNDPRGLAQSIIDKLEGQK